MPNVKVARLVHIDPRREQGFPVQAELPKFVEVPEEEPTAGRPVTDQGKVHQDADHPAQRPADVQGFGPRHMQVDGAKVLPEPDQPQQLVEPEERWWGWWGWVVLVQPS